MRLPRAHRVAGLVCLASLICLTAPPAAAQTDTRLLRSPDIHGDTLVFVHAGDIWTAPVVGGTAKRLTSHPGQETAPRFSPDGQVVAFSGEYDGNVDVYVIPAAGGEPRRLTWHPGADRVTGWSPDGRWVYFSSGRDSHNRRFEQMFRVSVDGGPPERLPLPTAYLGDQSPDGRLYAYTPLPNPFNWWRRYRGGLAPYIWVYHFDDHSVRRVPGPAANDTFPLWRGEELLFLSDRDRVMNLHAWHPQTDEVRQVTRLTGPDIKAFGCDGQRIVVELDGWLHLVDRDSGQLERLRVNVPAEHLSTRPRFVNVANQIQAAAISPTGKRVAVEARGEILTLPADKGSPRNLTRTTDRVERGPAWSPDGRWVACFGQHQGEYHLQLLDQQGQTAPRIIQLPFHTYYFNLTWSPDARRVAFTDAHLNLYVLALADERPVKVATNRFSGGQSLAWSPDSRWLAFEQMEPSGLRAIHLYHAEEGRTLRLTDGMSDAFQPVFDRGGKYLYFAASTNRTFAIGGLDMTSYLADPNSALYLAVLPRDEPSPFRPESDEEKAIDSGAAPESKEAKPEGSEPDGDKPTADTPAAERGKGPAKPQPSVTVVDPEGLDQRIVALPLPPGRYQSLSAGADGTLYYLAGGTNPREGANLHRFNLKKREAEELGSGIGHYQLSADGKKLLYSRARNLFLVDAGKIKPGDGALKTADLQVRTDPVAEWGQMLHEAWKLQREYFYDPGMHGQDWPEVLKNYQTWLPHIKHRDDLNYVIGMLIGELAAGHAYVTGGEMPSVPRVGGGLLGADFALADGRYRFTHIYSGENWNPDLRAPLTEPGVDVRVGDYLLAVDGRPLTATDNVHAWLEQTAGRQISLTVSAAPDGSDSRRVTVVPVANDQNLRHREWIQANARKVEQMTQGRVGYVYMPDTGTGGWTAFNRYFFAQIGKQGLVIDERWNGGGKVADYVIDLLGRPLLCYWQPRQGEIYTSPRAAIFGPKAMIVNEWAGSGGDALPYFFRQRNLGLLIGKRTWGGLVGISGYPPLMDGGRVTAPTFAIVSPDGRFVVENEGVAPDIEVEITPADLLAGRDPQLERAVQEVLRELEANPPPVYRPEPFPRGR